MNIELEELKKKYSDLEEEKKRLYEEIRDEKIEMKKKMYQLEKDEKEPVIIKEFSNLSSKQKKRRIQALSNRAKKALWFSKCFGLELDSITFSDENGHKYSWTESNQASTQSPPLTEVDIDKATPTAFKQYDKLSQDDKIKIESILFLMDKFAVGDAFVHELCMILDDSMPKSYLIKQCRDKLNQQCIIKPTPGPEPGAQISFKTALINNLKLLVSIIN